jgi:hypothetical protein
VLDLEGGGSVRLPGPDAALALILDGADVDLPAEYELGQNYPNPFNPSTTIRYAVPVKSGVFIGIYAVTGQLVRTMHSGEQRPGFHEVVWDGHNDAGVQAGSGVYFARLISGSFNRSRKLLLLR